VGETLRVAGLLNVRVAPIYGTVASGRSPRGTLVWASAGASGGRPTRTTVELEITATPLALPPWAARIGIQLGWAVINRVPQSAEPANCFVSPFDLIDPASGCPSCVGPLGDRMGYSGSHVSSVETMARVPTAGFGKKADEALGTPGTFGRLHGRITREAHRPWFAPFVDFEALAARIHNWDTRCLTGLIQTEDYASAAGRAEDGADLSQELAVLEYIASEYPYAWLKLADLYEEVLRDPVKAIHAVNRYLEGNPEDQEAWRRLIALYRQVDDVLGEMHARLQLAELTTPPFYDLSSAANRLNGLLSRQEIEIDADERRLIAHRLRRLMEDRNSEADATDLSRLAWLCMYDKDPTAAERWVDEGLRREPGTEYCQGLKEKLAGWR
jgi:hypothetical protein